MNWDGPVVAVVYVPLLFNVVVSPESEALNGTTIAKQIKVLDKFHEELEGLEGEYPEPRGKVV